MEQQIDYCCERFRELASGDEPVMEMQWNGKGWMAVANELVALYGMQYCPFCGCRLPALSQDQTA